MSAVAIGVIGGPAAAVIRAYAVYTPDDKLIYDTIHGSRAMARGAFMRMRPGARQFWPRYAARGYLIRPIYISRTAP